MLLKDNYEFSSKFCSLSKVDIKDIIYDENEFDNDFEDEVSKCVIEDCVFGDSKEYNKVLNEKGKHYLEKFKYFPNQIFFIKEILNKID